MAYLKKFFQKPIFQNQTFLLIIWLTCAFASCAAKIPSGQIQNNYIIFVQSFWHALAEQPLYIEYPTEYHDIFLYGISFTSIIAPFALLPNAIGAILWRMANAYLLFIAVKQLKLERWAFAVIIWFSVNELFLPSIFHQYNVGIAAMIILAFAFIEQRKELWATLAIAVGALTKIYGIVGLAFFLFSKKKATFIWTLIAWSAVVFALPMIYSSPEYVLGQYHEWFNTLTGKHELNTFCSYTNISLLGMVRKISHIATYSDSIIIIPGMILFAMPYLRRNQYQSRQFRLLYLSSTLLFMTLFSSGTEGSGYIGAIIGVAIWYTQTPTNQTMFKLNTTLLIFCFIVTSLSPTDIFPKYIRENYINTYALKALPCAIIWLKIVWEQMSRNFIETAKQQTYDSQR